MLFLYKAYMNKADIHVYVLYKRIEFLFFTAVTRGIL
jgi:hypothetical protein